MLAGAESLFVGKVGDDPQGREYLKRLASFGVDTSRMESVAGARPEPRSSTTTARART